MANVSPRKSKGALERSSDIAIPAITAYGVRRLSLAQGPSLIFQIRDATSCPGGQSSCHKDGGEKSCASPHDDSEGDHRPGAGEQARIAHCTNANRNEKDGHVGENCIAHLAEFAFHLALEMQPDQQRGHAANWAR